MKNAMANIPPSQFQQATFGEEEEDDGEWVSSNICTETGLLATPYCPSTETRYFRPGDEPTEKCQIHSKARKNNVPSIIGMEEYAASAAIRAAGLVSSVSYAYSSSVPAGHVISQTPIGGTTASPGSTVIITVSTGSRPQQGVPNVIGMSETSAKQSLSSAGFTYRVVYSPSDQANIGNVISQFPAGGVSAAPGSQVIITVGK